MSEQIVSVDQQAIKSELKVLVKTTVEQTLNELLNEEANELVGAGRYERSAERDAYRSGHYKRKAHHHVRRDRAGCPQASRMQPFRPQS